MKYVTLLILLLLTGSSFAQSNKRDSLWNLLSIVKEDSSKINLLTELGQFYANNSTSDSALLMFYKGLELATTGYKKGELKLQGVLTYYLWSLGDFSNSIGMGYHMLESAKARKDTARLVGAYALLFNSYRDLGDFEEALKLVNESLTLSKKFSGNNCESCGTFTAMIGSAYFEMGKYDSALHYLQKSLMYPKDETDGWILLITGRTWEKLGNRKLALENYRKSIDQLAAVYNMKDLAGAYTSLANLFTKINQQDSALHFGNLALNLAEQSGFKRELMDAYLALSAAYEGIDNSEALAYYKRAHNLKNDIYNQAKQIQILNYKFNEELRRKEVEVSEDNFNNRIRMNVMFGSTFTLLVIVGFLIRNSRLKQKAKRRIETAFNQLQATQSQLIQSEKMASLGELTAGIAHEIQNPLNFVNNFSEVNTELIKEIQEERRKTKEERDEKLENELLNDIADNEQKINHHGKRADAIVKGMLQHSRASSGQKELTDINTLCDEYLRLSYHGLRAKDKSFNAKFETAFDSSVPKINIVPQEIGRVVLNLINNAFYAVNEKRKTNSTDYEPTVLVTTKKEGDRVLISVNDNGKGIPDSIKEKIFQPFFTTKPTGQGTGLGLSLSYDIVKAHGGELKVESKEGEGSTFSIQLPLS